MLCVTSKCHLHGGAELEFHHEILDSYSFAVCPSECTHPMPSSLRPDLQQLCMLISSPQVISWSYGKPSSLYPPSVCRSCSFLSISMTPGYKPTLSQFHHHCPNCPLMFVSEIHSCPAVLKCDLSDFCCKLIKLTLLPWLACYWFSLTPQTLIRFPSSHTQHTDLPALCIRLYSLLLSHAHPVATTPLRCNTQRAGVCLLGLPFCHSP